ncbi:tetratricopeptide repeat protein [Neiella sp. HB171785]|uniref:Tetratricopeptide repeat protein n=1 Tax=Neiella litorisoli TaxID=2771431 RepID=A0A8J6UEQ7_9GAMM|nr:rhamnan synthesis F family protein [Neiella litorisoli]MBD1389789.1 tetratricopeptide repeat protein [Neiella litorisoli]
MNPRLFYLCTGFHRSGTSLVAQSLMRAGVSMGKDLMGPTIGNALGHIEDIPVVRLHDKALAANGCDWRYAGQAELYSPEWLQSEIKQYLQTRECGSGLQGVKDPRALLFLNDWEQAAGDAIRYVFTYRHWATAANSIFNRHSRELLYSRQQMSQRPGDMDFWSKPYLAFDMWAHNARKLIDFHRNCKERSLLIAQEALVDPSRSLAQLAKKIALPSSTFDSSVIQSDLTAGTYAESLLGMLSSEKIQVLNSLWEQLESAADAPGERSPSRCALSIPSSIKSQLESQLVKRRSLGNSFGISHGMPNESIDENEVKLLNWKQVLEKIKSYPPTKAPEQLFEELLSRTFGKAQDYMDVGILAVRHQHYLLAEVSYLRAINLNPIFWQYMHLGDLYGRLKEYQQAERCYQKGLELNPQGLDLRARLANEKARKGEFEEASKLLTEVFEHKPEHGLALRVLQRIEKHQTEASEEDRTGTIKKLITNHLPQIDSYDRVASALATSLTRGAALDRYMQQSIFLQRDNLIWLLNGIAQLENSAEVDLTARIFNHWRRLWPHNTLLVELFGVDTVFDLVFATPEKKDKLNSGLKIAVSLTVADEAFVPQVVDFLAWLPYEFDLLVTCEPNLTKVVEDYLHHSGAKNLHICRKENIDGQRRARVAIDERHLNYDLVCNVHTGPVNTSFVKGERLTSLLTLLGSTSIVADVVRAFESDSKLGVLMPPYHPHSVAKIGWGDCFEKAAQLADEFGLKMPQTVAAYPASMMFWYRPQALTDFYLRASDDIHESLSAAPDCEARLIPLLASKAGYQCRFCHHVLEMFRE